MIRTKLILLILVITCASAYGADSRPSDNSIDALLRVTEAHKILDKMKSQFDVIMKNILQEVFHGEAITPDKQKQVDDMQNQMVEMFKKEMSWENLEPTFKKIYSDTFTQKEVDDMLAF